MSLLYLACNMTHAVKTAAPTSSRATGEGRAALFAHQLGNHANPSKARRDRNQLLDWDSGSEREAIIRLPLPSSQEIQTPSISQATAHSNRKSVSEALARPGSGAHPRAQARPRAHTQGEHQGQRIVPAPLRLRCRDNLEFSGHSCQDALVYSSPPTPW